MKLFNFLKNNDMLKFCCDSFTSFYNNGEFYTQGKIASETFPNIKITKIEPSIFNKNTDLMRFVIICNSLNQNEKPLFILISYCPFCGCDLYKFYTNDEYINLDSKRLFL